ncbi:hypothetical protein FHS42_006654 [Streptomyces zagrosensis]|uniref:Uncharacterized protein n=1 Tax=Streptomyces zagrosensis TaxID=1042984 RepID=A0A7W9V1Q9_9ACTN|nr:hypothetical protein [Streptomyces zagrosensis]
MNSRGGDRSYSSDRELLARRRSEFLGHGASGADYFLPGFFLPAMARRGPLRVRALVLVR